MLQYLRHHKNQLIQVNYGISTQHSCQTLLDACFLKSSTHFYDSVLCLFLRLDVLGTLFLIKMSKLVIRHILHHMLSDEQVVLAILGLVTICLLERITQIPEPEGPRANIHTKVLLLVPDLPDVHN